jgi:eukaryotic-like serine/threonine-protein kinase
VGFVLRQKWRLDALLGVGGMAAVYAATHRNGKRGAVKMLHLELSTNEDARRRFLREGYVANAVGHPGAVSVLDDDIAEDGSVFLVMELLEGHTVEARAASRPGSRLDPGEVLAITDQLLDILAAAHGKGIVHRDIKPENLFLTGAGQVKVLDFGLARLNDRSSGASGQRLTVSGSAMGTPAFLPPEQALGNWDAVDARTDLWAVGATMFTLLTGHLVHEADNLNKLLLASMTQPARPVASVEPSVPPVVAAIFDRALAFERADRWPDAVAMRAAVRRARATIRGEVPVLPGSEPVGAGTMLSVEPVHRSPSANSIGPTSSEPRLALGKRGVVAGAALIGVLGAAAVFFATRSLRPAAVTEPHAPAASSPVTGALPTPEPAPSSSDAVPPTVTPSAQPPPVTPLAPEPTASARSARPKATAAPKDDPFKKW